MIKCAHPVLLRKASSIAIFTEKFCPRSVEGSQRLAIGALSLWLPAAVAPVLMPDEVRPAEALGTACIS
jgi:hypothetical protein